MFVLKFRWKIIISAFYEIMCLWRIFEGDSKTSLVGQKIDWQGKKTICGVELVHFFVFNISLLASKPNQKSI